MTAARGHGGATRPTEMGRDHEGDDPAETASADGIVSVCLGPSPRHAARVDVLNDDSRSVELPVRPDGVITSPPYPGLIDYHEQHRYAYELLGLRDRRVAEIGPASRGTGRNALDSYVDDMSSVLRHTSLLMAEGSPVVIVVNDSRSLYPAILERAGLTLEERFTRHVNRRTGRRAGEFFESVLVCRTG